jgi:DNA-binding response OmpR family regulator
MKLLIAEDDVFFRRLLEQILGSAYELVVADNGNDAWAELQKPDAPRLAILDWVMPGLSGPQVCRKVRACEPLSSAYLIILTAKNSTADIVSGLRAGADDYIAKPPDPEVLRARVNLGERVLNLQNAAESQELAASMLMAQRQRVRELAARCEHHREIEIENAQGRCAVEAYLDRVQPQDSCCVDPCTNIVRDGLCLPVDLKENHRD